MNTIYLIDVTNRDGVQTSRLGIAKLEKTLLNVYLNKIGVFQSEFGFPFTHHEINYLNANLELAEMGVIKPMRLSGWMRAVKEDVELSWKNVPGLEYANLSASTSEQMIKTKYQGRRGGEDVISEMAEAVKLARHKGAKSLGVNAEDASRTDMDYLIEFAKAAKKAGADRLRYCDTLGYDGPFTAYERVKELAKQAKMPVEMHCHNDLGMAVACSVAGAKGAIDAGQDAYINTTVNGIGERAGNADLVSVILALKHGSDFGGAGGYGGGKGNASTEGKKYHLDPRIDLKHAWNICKYASYAFCVPIPVNQPGVGSNAFAHESGIHADGALKDRRNYELYDYEELGRGEPELIDTGRKITVGEYSGIKGFKNVYGEIEIEFKDDAEAKKILELARYANVHKQKPLVTDELKFIAKYPDQVRRILTMNPLQ